MANRLNPLKPSNRNPLTHLAHRREVFWQITVPLLVGLLVLLALCAGVVWAAASPSGSVSQWAHISLIWMLVFALITTFFFLLITAGLVYAVTWLLGALPGFALQVQDIFIVIRFKVQKIADSAAEPVLQVRQTQAAAQQFWRGLGVRVRQTFGGRKES